MRTVTIRDASEPDLAAVADIYAYESEFAYSTFETRRRPLSDWDKLLTGADPFIVAEAAGRVLGFAYASTFRERPAYHRTRETSVYLDRSARAEGIGTRLYAELLTQLQATGCHTALAMIALPNIASVRLHEQHGFTLAGTLQEVGDKHDQLIDVGIYQLMFAEPEDQ